MFSFANDTVTITSDASTAISGLGTSLEGVWTGSDLLTAFTTVAPLIVLGIITGLVIGVVMHQIHKSKNTLGSAN